MRACCERSSTKHKAGVAQLVERNLAKVEVESSSLFSRSRISKGSLASLFVDIALQERTRRDVRFSLAR